MPATSSTSVAADQNVATPTAFPAAGTFGVTERVTLLCATPGATIHYTTDGSMPSAASPVFEAYKLPVLEAGDGPRTTAYTLKALAVLAGREASDVATFTYTIARRAPEVYLTQEILPGLHMIVDYDDTKMYLVVGRERALLIDAGLGRGDLRGLVETLIGQRSLEVLITHAHPDHIARMGQFVGRYPTYMNHRDLPLLERFRPRLDIDVDPALIRDVREGFVFDLGDYTFQVYEAPGHSAGCLALFDAAHGLLIAGDALGSNRPTITDSLWMQMPGMGTIDLYLSALQVFRSKVKGQIKVMYGGHNDAPIYGEQYLDNLQQAAQALVDGGETILTPSLRPTEAWQVVAGDRLTDPNWAAINVAKGTCLTAPPDQQATLSNLRVSPGALSAGFTPFDYHYAATVAATVTTVDVTPTATSSRCQGLTINGQPSRSGATFAAPVISGDNRIAITVTAPDGHTTQTYTLIVTRA